MKKKLRDLFPNVHVVLVRPHYSRNVGSCSRAMANMGAGRLILIAAECEINLEARQGAAGAQTRLMESTAYKNLKDFFAGEPDGLRIGFAARTKKQTDTLGFKERVEILAKAGEFSKQPIYLIFGPEDHGLENEDVEYLHYICALPIFGDFLSLNLSHAVLIALYIIKSQLAEDPLPIEEINPIEPYYFPEETLQKWLEILGFKIGDRRTDALKILRRILVSQRADAKELRILEAIVHQTIRKLKPK